MIFISHKKIDEGKAKSLGNFLTKLNIPNYVDVLDKSEKGGDITEYIVKQLRDSTHLIVIFSEYTKESMWVPFELGVAYERDHGIGVLLWGEEIGTYVPTPEYLDQFPILKSQKDIEKYIELYKKSGKMTIMQESANRNFSETTASSSTYAKTFIKNLKSSIRHG